MIESKISKFQNWKSCLYNTWNYLHFSSQSFGTLEIVSSWWKVFDGEIFQRYFIFRIKTISIKIKCYRNNFRLEKQSILYTYPLNKSEPEHFVESTHFKALQTQMFFKLISISILINKFVKCIKQYKFNIFSF